MELLNSFECVGLFAVCSINRQKPLLVALLAGQNAHDFEKADPQVMVQEVLGVLRSMYGAQRVPAPRHFYCTRWASDEFSHGSYSYIPVGASAKGNAPHSHAFLYVMSWVFSVSLALSLSLCCAALWCEWCFGCGAEYDDLALPVGRSLYFAGEATNKEHPATVPGALLSGLRAAGEIDSRDKNAAALFRVNLDKRQPSAFAPRKKAEDSKNSGAARAVTRKGVRHTVYVRRMDPAMERALQQRAVEEAERARAAALLEQKQAAERRGRLDEEANALLSGGLDLMRRVKRSVLLPFPTVFACTCV